MESLNSLFKSLKNNVTNQMVLASAIGVTLLSAFVIYNIRKSNPHDTTICVLTGGIIGSPIVKSGESKTNDSITNDAKDKLKAVLNDYIANGQDIGSQISIYVNNKEELNCYAVDKNRCSLYDNKSLHTVFSCTKNISALLISIAVHNGWIESYNDNVNKYWSKFPTQSQFFEVNKNPSSGKREIIFKSDSDNKYLTIADVLRHEGGLNSLWGDDKIISMKELDHNKIRDIIEDSKLTYRKYNTNDIPKTERFYHGLTRGFVLNEIFRRVEPKQRTMNQYFNDEMLLVLSRNDVDFKLYLKGRVKSDIAKVYHIENSNKIWRIYHVILSFISSSSIHLPKSNYFNKYLDDIKYSNFRRLIQLGSLNRLPRGHKSFAPEWENALTNTKASSKLFENESDIKMEWISSTGITNAHSMSKLLSYYLFNKDFNKTLQKIIDKPKAACDATLLASTEFTQGGFDRFEMYDIEWFGWGGLGGSIYAFAPKYKCVFSYTIMGYNRVDLCYDCDLTKNFLAQEPRAKVLFYYVSQYLKSM